MAKANRGSVKTKRELESAGVVKGKATAKTTDGPFSLMSDSAEIVDQPAFGASSVPTKTVADVQCPPDVPLDIHSFSFEIRPGIGPRWLCIAIRDDGEEQSESFDTKPEAENRAKELEKKLKSAEAKRAQETAEKAALITPIVTLNQVITLTPDNTPTSISTVTKLPEPEPVTGVIKDPIPEAAPPRFKGECVLATRRKDMPSLHVIPELAQAVTDFIALVPGEGVETFGKTDNGNLLILTYPSYRKAEFSYINGKAIITRR